MSGDFDVLIVGGGLVGASLACALRSSGLRIGLIEAAPLPSTEAPAFDDRTIALAYGGRRIFEGIGVWSALEARGVVPIRNIHISDRGRFGATRLSSADAELPALGYVVATRVLGGVLFDTLRDQTAITLLCPATVTATEYDEEGVNVTVKAGDETRAVRARLLVAADGADSPMRSAVGIKAERVTYDQVAVVTSVGVERPRFDTAYERFTEQGPLALLPALPDRYAVVWAVSSEAADELIGLEEDVFRERLQAAFGDRLGGITRLGRRQSYPLALTNVSEHVHRRMVLIGNAAHTVHPVAGQGFNLGLRDVAVLAEFLFDAAHAGEDPGARALLERYAAARVRDNRVISSFTHGLIRLFSNDLLPVMLLRSAGLVAVDLIPPLKRRLIRMTSGLAGRLPRLACGLPLSVVTHER